MGGRLGDVLTREKVLDRLYGLRGQGAARVVADVVLNQQRSEERIITQQQPGPGTAGRHVIEIEPAGVLTVETTGVGLLGISEDAERHEIAADLHIVVVHRRSDELARAVYDDRDVSSLGHSCRPRWPLRSRRARRTN